eukprot:GEMP01042212.1.p1 GENE.GEMP01042212.1~~GEMP01042212.1.p1  ORF type:complete len:368 (+),score=95.59 GEMP01042212.1:35-1138(+)
MANPHAPASFASLLPPPRHGRSCDDGDDGGKKQKTDSGDLASSAQALLHASSSLFSLPTDDTTIEPTHTARQETPPLPLETPPLPFFPKEASKLGSSTVPKSVSRCGLPKNGAIPKCARAKSSSAVTTKKVLTVKSSAPRPKVSAVAPVAPVAPAVASNSPPPPWRGKGGRDSPPPWRGEDVRPAFAKATPTAPALSISTAVPVPNFGTALDMMSEAKQKQDIGTALDMLAAAQKPTTQFERLIARLMRERDNKIPASFPPPPAGCSTVRPAPPVPSAPPTGSDPQVRHNAAQVTPVPTLKQIVNTYRLDMCSARELQRLDEDTCRRVIEECRERLASALYDPSELILSTIKSVVGRAMANSAPGMA